jgi:hypothetical protein
MMYARWDACTWLICTNSNRSRCGWLLSLLTPVPAFTGVVSAGGVAVTGLLLLTLEVMHTVAAGVGVGILVILARE